jgi:hypothetical protein
MASEELGFFRKTNGLVLVLAAVVAVFATLATFHPRNPSPFTAAGAFGAGHGSDGIMVGASPRLGAAR